MQRSRLRKFEAMATAVNMGRPEHRAPLEKALGGCRNGATRARLRSRIQRGSARL